jgi:hypothetical protein
MKTRVFFTKSVEIQSRHGFPAKLLEAHGRLGPNENPDKPGLSFERKTEVGRKTSGFSVVRINCACIRVLNPRRESNQHFHDGSKKEPQRQNSFLSVMLCIG